MTCPKCNATIDVKMQFCIKCGAAVCFSSEKARALNIARRIRGKAFFWGFLSACLTGILSLALGPHGDSSMLKANMCAVAARGRDIYVAIISANTDREPLGLPAVWPKTSLASTNRPGDISSKAFKTSSDYFYELYDGANVGTDQHNPYVKGVDYSKLAGAGVPACRNNKLGSANNMWLFAANITDEDDDIIPVMITRNVDVKDIERIINQGGPTSNLNTRIVLGMGEYKTPFGKKGFVMVRKNGGTFNSSAKYATLRVLFDSQPMPPRDPSKPPIVYLMP